MTSNEMYRGLFQSEKNRMHSVSFLEIDKSTFRNNYNSKYEFKSMKISNVNALLITKKSNKSPICYITESCELGTMTDDQSMIEETIQDLENTMNKNPHNSEIKFRKSNHPFASVSFPSMNDNSGIIDNIYKYFTKEVLIPSSSSAVAVFGIQELDKSGIVGDGQNVIIRLIPVFIWLVFTGIGASLKYIRK